MSMMIGCKLVYDKEVRILAYFLSWKGPFTQISLHNKLNISLLNKSSPNYFLLKFLCIYYKKASIFLTLSLYQYMSKNLFSNLKKYFTSLIEKLFKIYEF